MILVIAILSVLVLFLTLWVGYLKHRLKLSKLEIELLTQTIIVDGISIGKHKKLNQKNLTK